MTPREQATQTSSTPDLCAVSLVRLGDTRTVRRLLACGARIMAEGDHMGGLVLASDGETEREGILAVPWVIVRTMGGQRVLVVLMSDSDEEQEG